MIVEEMVAENRVRHFSDVDKMICQVETGHLYIDAVDVLPCRYTYEETNEPIPSDEPTVEDKAEAYDILMGEGI